MSLDQDVLTAARAITSNVWFHPVMQPPGGTAWATIQRVTGRRHVDLEGGGGAPKGRFQFDCWALSRANALDLAEDLKDGLPDLLTIGDIVDNPDDYDVDTKLHRISFDIEVWQD